MRIMLDRGHYTAAGEHRFDPGAISPDGTLHEAAVAHVIGWQVAQLVDGISLFKPDATLRERVEAFNAQHEMDPFDAFVSLHCNAALGRANGVEVLHYGPKTALPAARMTGAMCLWLPLKNRGAKERPELYVLRETKAPAFLIELGFVDNKKDMRAVIERGAYAVANALRVLGEHYNTEQEGES